MKIQLSARERYIVFFLLCKLQGWGGSEQQLETRLQLWEQLGLDAFDNQPIDQTKLSNGCKGWELTLALAEDLVATCCAPGQNVSLGIASARIVRKVRAVFPTTKPDAASP